MDLPYVNVKGRSRIKKADSVTHELCAAASCRFSAVARISATSYCVLWVRTVLYLETLDDIDFAQSLTSILTACPSRICIHVLCGSLLYLAGDAVTRCPIHYLLAAFYGTMCGFY